MQYISIISTIISFSFAASVLLRFRKKGGMHLLFWGIGLIFYGIGTLTEVILAFSFSAAVLKLWYYSGAMMTAAWLGQGSVFLLVRKGRIANITGSILVLVSLAALIMVLAAPINTPVNYQVSQPASTQYKEILYRNGTVVLLTVVLNIYGTLTLVGGALYSAYLFWRKKVLANRMIGNILIAAGAMFPAVAGAFVQAGLVDWLYISELFGVILMYAGFLKATAESPEISRKANPAPLN